MIINSEISGKNQNNLRAQYFEATCPFSRKLICSILSKKHYVVLGQLLRFYLDRVMRLVKVHRAISFNSSPYVAGGEVAGRGHGRATNVRRAGENWDTQAQSLHQQTARQWHLRVEVQQTKNVHNFYTVKSKMVPVLTLEYSVLKVDHNIVLSSLMNLRI